MPKISVIVPVYRTEAYLARCVDSILSQTHTDLELLLIDDGSPDCCPQLCDEFAAKDSRVRVIHKENGGVSTARNAGLDAAAGDYIAFVDSDDWIEPDMYEKMLAAARQYNCDVMLCDCVKEYPDGSRPFTHHIRPGFYDEGELQEAYYPHLLMMENVEYPPTISNCLILWKASLNTPDLRYEPGIRYSEDLLFGARLMRRAKSFFYMKGEEYYHYDMNPQSASHSFAPDKWEDYRRLYRRICDCFYGDPEYDFRHQTDLCLLFFVYNAIGDIRYSGLPGQEKEGKTREILNSPEVRKMFARVKIRNLPISVKLKLLTAVYKYRMGISYLVRDGA